MIASLSRRRFLATGGAILVVTACGSDGGGETSSTSVTPPDVPPDIPPGTALTAAHFDRLDTCVLLPESTAGPFPLDEQFDRRDITEGVPGHPLRLGLRVVDDACEPVAGAAVEIWHTDTTGDYSAFEDGGGGKDDAEGTTFCRGTQVAGDDGIVEFQSVYPGWYPGRAVHIHVRVRVADAVVSTGQVYFADDYTAGVFAEDPYAEFGLPNTTNGDDGIAGDPATEGTLLALAAAETSAGAGTLGLLNLGVDITT